MSIDVSKVWFASFADTRLSSTLHRIGEQAAEFGFAAGRSRLWTEKDLGADFVRKMGKRLNPLARLLKNVRGAFGIDTQW